MMMARNQSYMIGDLLYLADDRIAPWVLERIKEMRGQDFGPCTAIGIVQNSRIVGGVVFSMYRKHSDGGDITISVALDPKCRVTPKILRGIFEYPFKQLGCARVTSFVVKTNKVARRFNERTGWKLEGVRRKGFGKHDILMFGMLANECRYLKAKV